MGILAIDVFTCGDLEKGKNAYNTINEKLKIMYPSIKLKQKYEINRFMYQ